MKIFSGAIKVIPVIVWGPSVKEAPIYRKYLNSPFHTIKNPLVVLHIERETKIVNLSIPPCTHHIHHSASCLSGPPLLVERWMERMRRRRTMKDNLQERQDAE